MQGPSEFGITGDATLKNWDVRNQLKNIFVPTLVIFSFGNCSGEFFGA